MILRIYSAKGSRPRGFPLSILIVNERLDIVNSIVNQMLKLWTFADWSDINQEWFGLNHTSIACFGRLF